MSLPQTYFCDDKKQIKEKNFSLWQNSFLCRPTETLYAFKYHLYFLFIVDLVYLSWNIQITMDLWRWILFFLATSNDSVEGIVYNVNQSVIMTGQYVEEEEVEKDKINRMGLWFKPWFYKYVEKFLEKVKMTKSHSFSFFNIFPKKFTFLLFFFQGETIEYVPTLHFHQVIFLMISNYIYNMFGCLFVFMYVNA